jgi:hypothetical protein
MDGTDILGQVLEPTARGGFLMLVRRDWARSKAPNWLRAWERVETPRVRLARRERKARLIAWQADRAGAGGGSPVDSWIPREIARLSTLNPPRTVLTAAEFSRSDVRKVDRRDEPTARMLRLGWLAGLGGVESMSANDLRDALAFRGLLRPERPAFVDSLLPLYPEPEDRWRMRRAATEVAFESDLRFVQFRQFFLPETGPGSDASPRTTSELIDSPVGRDAFGAINAVTPFDAVQLRLDDLADRGRTGAVMTRLEFNVDSDQAEAETVFWVRRASGQWTTAFTQKASARTDEPDDVVRATPDAESTPIRTTVMILETVAGAASAPAVSERRQNVAAAAQRAMGRARAALNRDLAPFVLPVLAGTR